MIHRLVRTTMQWTGLAATAAVFLAIASGPAVAAEWAIDAGHSSAQFKVRHLMVSTVTGSLGKVTGAIQYDPADPTKSSVEANIDTTTITTAHEARDNHLKSPDFFDVAKFPAITFKSKKVEKSGDGRLKVTGDLTMKGVTKEVALDVEGPMTPVAVGGGNLASGLTATTKINRQDFGVSWSKTMDGGGLVVSDEVTITIDLEIKQKKQG